ncbi:four helix bundle protein [Hoylesella buccalis]|uniref:Four helix bundle protein n=1 Tax=Hoylesella buccalis TaxID=28127 RepID=A0A2N6QTK9_9BACT|nr:four helix bundle protein [Hoylesella buccalis]PMC25381.1 four helix bundle protein [Hoylesella buccalis]
MGTFRDLSVWQKSMNLTRRVYELTASYPQEERFGLVSQMRRCAVSIPSNISEGYGRETNNEHIRFLYISLGSCNELETQLILSQDLAFVTTNACQELVNLVDEVSKMLKSLIYTEKYK